MSLFAHRPVGCASAVAVGLSAPVGLSSVGVADGEPATVAGPEVVGVVWVVCVASASTGRGAVLVSEFMLQQTPVARVLPVYEQWLRTWPTPADLAAAAPGEAVRAWGRLGYPRRALRLHAAATAIVGEHGGAVPDTYEDLLAL